MKHHRSPTHSYPQNIAPPSIYASLALRHPTLLSPIANLSPPGDDDTFDDFQSNAWVSARPPLAGLGINYLRNTSMGLPLAPEDSAQTDGAEELLSLHDHSQGIDILPDDFPGPTAPHRDFDPAEDRHTNQPTSIFVPSLDEGSNVRFDLGLDSDIDPTASDIVGLIPDVNMYQKLQRLDLSHPGVNPLDTICGSLLPVGISCEELTSVTPEDNRVVDIPPTRVEQSPSPRVIQDIMSILVQPAPEFSFPPWPPSAQCISPSQQASPGSSLLARPELVTIPDGGLHASPTSCNLQWTDSSHSSPVLNAHLGIELNELISKAERFKVKYPERDIDRAWLSHFAGKLSDRGELLNDFRCYVIGCDQRNKRRDHILVHVGAHIGQRPFACSVCPLRFLRKNECKRHEASHSGFRPYSCDICGQSFVRQDLVKRHVKRTHGLRDENDSGVARQPSRKRARLQ